MIGQLTPEQIQDLPWVSLDDLLDARADVEEHGRCWAEIVDDDGEVRLKRKEPPCPKCR